MPNSYEDKYLFVDGGYWRETLKRFSERYFPGEMILLDYKIMTHPFQKTFYYDCLPKEKEGDTKQSHEERTSEQEALFGLLKILSGVHVFQGSVKGEGDKSRQKMIDTMMAVDLLTHSHRKNAAYMTLIAGDLDFKPIVDALVQNGTYVILLYDHRHASADLIDSADSRIPITIRYLYNCSTAPFRDGHQIPAYHSEPDTHLIDGCELVEKGIMNDGTGLELYKKEAKFVVAFQPTAATASRDYIIYSRRDVLERYLEDHYGPFTWDKS